MMSRKAPLRVLLAALALVLVAPLARAGQTVRIAAAADLRYALTEVVAEYRKTRPDSRIEPIFGSSGKFATQIENGAPFDLFFSADVAYPERLHGKGLCASAARRYARGRIVIWSTREEVSTLTVKQLAEARFRKLAIANPEHAPYGKRAREALERAGIWSVVQSRLVFGENVSSAAQLVESGAADAGIIALSLALTPELAVKGRHAPIPEDQHQPLEQGYVLLAAAAANPAAVEFSRFVDGPAARAILRRYGFALPGEKLP